MPKVVGKVQRQAPAVDLSPIQAALEQLLRMVQGLDRSVDLSPLVEELRNSKGPVEVPVDRLADLLSARDAALMERLAENIHVGEQQVAPVVNVEPATGLQYEKNIRGEIRLLQADGTWGPWFTFGSGGGGGPTVVRINDTDPVDVNVTNDVTIDDTTPLDVNVTNNLTVANEVDVEFKHPGVPGVLVPGSRWQAFDSGDITVVSLTATSPVPGANERIVVDWFTLTITVGIGLGTGVATSLAFMETTVSNSRMWEYATSIGPKLTTGLTEHGPFVLVAPDNGESVTFQLPQAALASLTVSSAINFGGYIVDVS